MARTYSKEKGYFSLILKERMRKETEGEIVFH
jgi:hypothetical protein